MSHKFIAEINKILSEWDPIDIGCPFSLNEYEQYVQKINLILNDKDKLKLYLIESIGKMGLSYDPKDHHQEKDLDDVIRKFTGLVDR